MIAWLRAWVLGMTGAALFCAIATALTPRGAVKELVKVVCGVVMAAALAAPLFSLPLPDYALSIARWRSEGAAIAAEGESLGGEMSRPVLEAEYGADRLDKAAALGAAVNGASVSVRWTTEGVWVPVAAEVCGLYSAPLAAAIEAELGIAREEIRWIDENA